MSQQYNAFGQTQWMSGFCSCDDLGVCLYAWFCPGCAFASARSSYDSSNWLFNLIAVPPTITRSIIREGYQIEGNCCGDICLPYWFTPCVAAQLINEVKKRGPSAPMAAAGHPEKWRAGLCDFECGPCCFAYWCMQCSLANTRQKFDRSNWCLNCMCMWPGLVRNIVREGYGIEGDCCSDILLGCFCQLCTAVQCHREVHQRGQKSPKAVTMGGPPPFAPQAAPYGAPAPGYAQAPQYPPAQILGGRRFGLRSINGWYLQAKEGGGVDGPDSINCSVQYASTWETFEGVAVAPDVIGLRLEKGYFVSAMGGGGSHLNTHPLKLDQWEQFRVEIVNTEPALRIALRSVSNHYVSAENGGGQAVSCNRGARGDWEIFTVEFK